MKIIMVNEYKNFFKVAESEKQMYEYERLGFKKYVEPKPIVTAPIIENEQIKEPKAKPNTKKKAVKKNG